MCPGPSPFHGRDLPLGQPKSEMVSWSRLAGRGHGGLRMICVTMGLFFVVESSLDFTSLRGSSPNVDRGPLDVIDGRD